MAVSESKLIVSLLDKLTAPAKSIQAALGRLQGAAALNAKSLDNMRGRMFDSVAMGYALARGLSAPVKAAVAFESSMADVAKVVDFASPVAFKQMGEDIRKMSTRIPIAADGLAQIVAAAGQSGIANSDLLKFTELAAKVGVAWDMSADQAGDAMAKLKTALGRSVEDTASLADAINELGNKSAASAPQILDVVKRVAPMAKQFGMTAEQVAALGAAMTGSGFESEVAATSILNIGRALTRGEGVTKRQSDAFQALGLNSKKVAKSMQKDAMGTLQNVLTRVSKLPKEMQASVVSDLFGDEARALGPLISNGKLLGDTLEIVGDKATYAGSAQREFETRSKTSANNLQLFQNRLNDLAISVGDALLPAMNKLLDKLGPMVTTIGDLAKHYPNLTAAITAATAALVAFRIAATAARFAGLYAIGGIIRLGIAGLNFAAIFASVGTALAAVGAALATITAPVWAAIAAAVALVAAAGFALWRYWDRVSSVLGGVASRIWEELAPAFSYLKPLLTPFIHLAEAVGAGFEAVRAKLGEFSNWIMGFFRREWLPESQKAALAQAGYDAADRMINSIKERINTLIEWFKSLPSRILEAVGNIDLGSLIKWPQLPEFLGGPPASDQPASASPGAPAPSGAPNRASVFNPRTAQLQPSSVTNNNQRTADVHQNLVINNHFTTAADPGVAAKVAGDIGQLTKSAVESNFGAPE